MHHVQLAREMTERELAEDGCRIENDPLFIDGGVSRGEIVARSTCVVGVVKSHRTL